MSQQFEELSKNLAKGMSRRKAFLRFGAGLGVTVLGVMTGKRAYAEKVTPRKICEEQCKLLKDQFPPGHQHINRQACINDCVRCFEFNTTTCVVPG